MSDSHTKSRIRNLATTHLPILLYCIVGLGFLFQGVRYISATELMPYHLAVIETPWEGLDSSYQTLFLGLLKGFGTGSFCVGLAIILLALIPLRRGSRWARWVIPVIALTYTSALIYVTSFALLPGATPILVTTTLLGFVIAAVISSFFSADSDAG